MGRMQLMEEWWGEHEHEHEHEHEQEEGKGRDLSKPAGSPGRGLILQDGSGEAAYDRVRELAAGNAVVVFSHSGCCMCHVVKRLLLGLGVGPAVYELDLEKGGAEIQAVLYTILSASSSATLATCNASSATAQSSSSSSPVLPAVFVGGKLVGGLEAVMACHINGTLIPLLKQAGALWL